MENTTLTTKLNLFIKAYYDNIIKKGTIVFVIVFCILFIIITLLEYFSYFQSGFRAVLFYGFIVINIAVLVWQILIPWFKKHQWIKGISHEEAAKIIGKHFPEIDDKLLNAVQLQSMTKQCPDNKMELLLASIEEKTLAMNKFHFSLAINLKSTRKYFKYVIALLVFIATIFIFDNRIFTQPTQRIVHYSQYFEKPAPYFFTIENENLQAFENENFTINITVDGDEIPEEAFININKVNYKLEKKSKNQYRYELKNLQQDVDIYIYTEEVTSKKYQIKVLPKPILIGFSMHLDYPNYIGRPNETIENNGDISVPQGTKITWKLNSRNTDNILFRCNEQIDTLFAAKDESVYTLKVMNNITYSIINVNQYVKNLDSITYTIDVIADNYPIIDVVAVNDSAFIDRFYFKGNIKDDYGFTQLQFVYTIKENDEIVSSKKVDLPIETDNILQDFYHYFDAQTLQLSAGQSIEYYFEVFDNDAINGAKSSKSTLMEFHLPSLKEIEEQQNKSNLQTRKDIAEILKDSEKILQQIDDLKKKMVNQNQPSWEEKKQMENLLQQLKDIRQQGEKILEEQKRQEYINEQYQNLEDEIVVKQKEIQRRINELFNDEMKSMIEEIERLMQQNIDKNKMNQMLQDIKINTEELNQQLDQNLELFKQMELESKMNNISTKAEQLSKEEYKLAEETAENKKENAQLEEKQKSISQDFKGLQQTLQEAQNLNQELENPYKLDSLEQLTQEIEKDLQEAQKALQNNNKSKAVQHQKSAAEKMEKLAIEAEEKMADNKAEQLGEDINTIRQILDNIVKVSFAQENIMTRMSTINPQDALMRTLIQEQYQLKDGLRLIEDSIAALAKRQIMVEPFITKQVKTIKQAQADILDLMSKSQEPALQYYYGNNIRQITAKEQFTMKSLNDLGLMLAESMKKMEEEESNCKNGSCAGNKPKGGKKSKSGKKSAQSMRQMQEKLNQQLQQMRQQMQEGAKPGQKNNNGQSLSEQFARMAAQQEAIRKMMQDYQSELKKEGGGYAGLLEQIIKEMQQTEKELVNKQLNQQTINRQEQILTRLLQSERAELQREKEEIRESKQGVDLPKNTPPSHIEHALMKKKETELYKTIPPTLNRYYRDKVNTYFYKFNTNE